MPSPKRSGVWVWRLADWREEPAGGSGVAAGAEEDPEQARQRLGEGGRRVLHAGRGRGVAAVPRTGLLDGAASQQPSPQQGQARQEAQEHPAPTVIHARGAAAWARESRTAWPAVPVAAATAGASRGSKQGARGADGEAGEGQDDMAARMGAGASWASAAWAVRGSPRKITPKPS